MPPGTNERPSPGCRQAEGRAVSPSTTPHRMPAVLTMTPSPPPRPNSRTATNHPHRGWRTRPRTSSPGPSSNNREVADDSDAVGWRDVIRSAAGDGYVVLHESLATTNGGVRLLPTGRMWVESLRERRADRRLRHAALQTEILLWLRTGCEDLVLVDDFPADAGFEGSLYEDWERERGWESLQERKLVTGTDSANGIYLARLTADGRDCVDQFGGSVSEYLRAQQRPNNNVTVHGNNSGNIASGNRDVVKRPRPTPGLTPPTSPTSCAPWSRSPIGSVCRSRTGRNLSVPRSRLSTSLRLRSLTSIRSRRLAARSSNFLVRLWVRCYRAC